MSRAREKDDYALMPGVASSLELEYPARLVEPSAWLGHVPFALWLVAAIRPRVIVELGVHTGNSYCAFLQAVQTLGLDTRCFGVDHWQGDEHAGYYGDEVYQELLAYHDARYGTFSTLLRSSFEAALPLFSDGSVDLIHIDGFHTYEAVTEDFTSWLPKTSSRAVALFHDTNVREGNFGIWRFWEEAASRYPHFEFLHSHGLGVAYLGSESLTGPLKTLFAATGAQTERIRAYFARLGTSITDCRAAQTLAADLAAANARERRLRGEVQDRDRRLVAADEELQRAHATADSDRRDLAAQVHERDRRLVAANQDLRRLIGEVAQHDQRLAAADRDLRRLLDEVEDRERRLTAADRDLQRLTGEAENRERRLVAADGDLRRLTGEVEDRERRLVAADADLRRLRGEVEDHERRLVAADADLRRLMGELEDRQRRLVAADGDLRRLMGELEDRERRLVAADADLRRLAGEVEDREQRLVAADGDLRRLMGEIEERERRLIAVDGDLRRLIGEVEQREHRLHDFVVQLGDRDRKLVAANEERRQLIRTIADQNQRLAAADDELRRMMKKADLDLLRANSVIADRDQRLMALGRRLHEIETSTAWRITAPVRKLFPASRRAYLTRKRKVNDSEDLTTGIEPGNAWVAEGAELKATPLPDGPDDTRLQQQHKPG